MRIRGNMMSGLCSFDVCILAHPLYLPTVRTFGFYGFLSILILIHFVTFIQYQISGFVSHFEKVQSGCNERENVESTQLTVYGGEYSHYRGVSKIDISTGSVIGERHPLCTWYVAYVHHVIVNVTFRFDSVLEIRMAKDPKTVWDFLHDLNEKVC